MKMDQEDSSSSSTEPYTSYVDQGIKFVNSQKNVITNTPEQIKLNERFANDEEGLDDEIMYDTHKIYKPKPVYNPSKSVYNPINAPCTRNLEVNKIVENKFNKVVENKVILEYFGIILTIISSCQFAYSFDFFVHNFQSCITSFDWILPNFIVISILMMVVYILLIPNIWLYMDPNKDDYTDPKRNIFILGLFQYPFWIIWQIYFMIYKQEMHILYHAIFSMLSAAFYIVMIFYFKTNAFIDKKPFSLNYMRKLFKKEIDDEIFFE